MLSKLPLKEFYFILFYFILFYFILFYFIIFILFYFILFLKANYNSTQYCYMEKNFYLSYVLLFCHSIIKMSVL
jgi:heme/copper-type cytochrome/quinol oxidase subunit 2